MTAGLRVYGGGGGGGAPLSSVLFTTPSIAAAATATGTVELGKGYRVSRVQSDKPCRIRLYTTAASRTADADRPRTAEPTGNHGLIAEIILTGTLLDLTTLPQPLGSVTGSTYYSVTNDGSSTGTVPVTVTRQILEV